MDITDAAELIKTFQNESLTKQISTIESNLASKDLDQVSKVISEFSITSSMLDAALTFKQAAGQINVIIHALGILLSLPYILEKNEVVQALSLGAGNTGKPFDLETDCRVAEYKFIHWQGGAEAIRQNQLFKDYFLLAEFDTPKKKYLYVLGKEMPIKFFQGGRALSSVLSKNRHVDEEFHRRFGNKFTRVNEYYQQWKNEVELVDLREILPTEIGKLFK